MLAGLGEISLLGCYRPSVTSKPLPFKGSPPDRGIWVLAQAIPFRPQKWRDALPDPALWPTELEATPTDYMGRHLVDRCTVLRIGERATIRLAQCRHWSPQTCGVPVHRRVSVSGGFGS